MSSIVHLDRSFQVYLSLGFYYLGKEDASRQQRLFGQFGQSLSIIGSSFWQIDFRYQWIHQDASLATKTLERSFSAIWSQFASGRNFRFIVGIRLYSRKIIILYQFSLASKTHVEVSQLSFTLEDHSFNLGLEEGSLL